MIRGRFYMRSKFAFVALVFLLLLMVACAQGEAKNDKLAYPKLILQKSAVPSIAKGIEKYPLLKESFEKAKRTADAAIEAGITVPFPKDPGGGYTHEKHKQNYNEMYNAGVVYQLTGEEKYAVFVRDMLLEYAKLYPTLGLHPMRKNQSPGKLFWQGLNESVWLVYSIQAYDCIHDFLTAEESENIENNLFRQVVKFFTEEDSYSFNRVHNHGTWAVAGVGMTGMVLGDASMVKQALYSTHLDGSGGFLKQIETLFSPDGYYAEGPYYQRYALLPFVVFAQALENNMPELKIFEYKNGVLKKAVSTLLQMTNSDGRFYPVNDAIKEKSWLTPELVFGTNIVYALTGDPTLLDVAQKQGRVMLSVQGLEVAKAVAEGKAQPFKRIPMLIHDGPDGKQGGLAILRVGEDDQQTSVLYKFSSQGMGHGHFDRLSINLFDKGEEIIPDYGAARFLNVAAKEGGRYLPENSSWAKQTIAHNTLVVNRQSNFEANSKVANRYSPVLLFSDLDSPDIQIVAARDTNCYSRVSLTRTLVLFQNEGRTFLVDLFDIESGEELTYDLPIYFNGQIIDTNFDYKRLTEYRTLGDAFGYQHLIVDAEAAGLTNPARVTWMQGVGFYSVNHVVDAATQFKVVRLGANDPNYNLRSQIGMVFSGKAPGKKLLLTVYEMHGSYNPVTEAVLNSESALEGLRLIRGDNDRVAVQMILRNKQELTLLIDLSFSNSENSMELEGKSVGWKGNYQILTHKN